VREGVVREIRQQGPYHYVFSRYVDPVATVQPGETVAVHTAPLSWWQRQTSKLNAGDTVTMSGKDISLDGKKCYCATEVVSADGNRVVIYPDNK